jgi:hypothetical protein
MKSIYSMLFSCLILFTSSCKKGEGVGGTSSIRGKVYATYFDKSLYTITDSAYAPDIDIYIIYGDEYSVGDRLRTSYDGSYEFKYLREGNYKIYALSKDTSGYYKKQANRYSVEIPIVKEVEIKGRRQNVQAPQIYIIQ